MPLLKSRQEKYVKEEFLADRLLKLLTKKKKLLELEKERGGRRGGKKKMFRKNLLKTWGF